MKQDCCPRISIVTPSYNQAAYIERTIESVASQNYPNTEHIVIDGGSTDGTLDILRRHSDRLAFWVSEKDEGQTHAINKGLRLATGQLLAYQNSDDVYLPGAFQAIAEAYRRHPGCGLYSGDVRIIDENDNAIDEIRLIHPRLFLQLSCGPQIHNQAAFWTREAMQRIGMLDESYVFDMDYDYFTRMLVAGIRCCHIRRHVGGFRVHRDTKTRNLRHVQIAEKERATQKYREFSTFYWILPRRIARYSGTCFKGMIHLVRGELGYLTRKRVGVKQ